MGLLRRGYGVAAPVIREMEVRDCFGGGVDAGEGGCWCGRAGEVHADVLSGRDWDVEWEDVFCGGDGLF